MHILLSWTTFPCVAVINFFLFRQFYPQGSGSQLSNPTTCPLTVGALAFKPFVANPQPVSVQPPKHGRQSLFCVTLSPIAVAQLGRSFLIYTDTMNSPSPFDPGCDFPLWLSPSRSLSVLFSPNVILLFTVSISCAKITFFGPSLQLKIEIICISIN